MEKNSNDNVMIVGKKDWYTYVATCLAMLQRGPVTVKARGMHIEKWAHCMNQILSNDDRIKVTATFEHEQWTKEGSTTGEPIHSASMIALVSKM